MSTLILNGKATAINLEASLALALPDLFGMPSSGSAEGSMTSGLYALSELTDVDNGSLGGGVPRSPRGNNRRGNGPVVTNRISFADDPRNNGRRPPSPSDGGYTGSTNKFGLSLDFSSEDVRLDNRRKRQAAILERRQQWWALRQQQEQEEQRDATGTAHTESSSTATSPRKAPSPLPQSPTDSSRRLTSANVTPRQEAIVGRNGSLRMQDPASTTSTRKESSATLPRRRSAFPNEDPLEHTATFTGRRSILLSDDEADDGDDAIPFMESIHREAGQGIRCLVGQNEFGDEQDGSNDGDGDAHHDRSETDEDELTGSTLGDRELQVLKLGGGTFVPTTAHTATGMESPTSSRSVLKKKSSFTGEDRNVRGMMAATSEVNTGAKDEDCAAPTDNHHADPTLDNSSSASHPTLTPLVLPASPPGVHATAAGASSSSIKKTRFTAGSRIELPLTTPHLSHVSPRTRAKLRTPASTTGKLGSSPMPLYTLPPKSERLSTQLRGESFGGVSANSATDELLEHTDDYEEGFGPNLDGLGGEDDEDPFLLAEALKVCDGDEVRARSLYRMELVRRTLQKERLQTLGPFEDLVLSPEVALSLGSALLDQNHSEVSAGHKHHSHHDVSSPTSSDWGGRHRKQRKENLTAAVSNAFSVLPKSIVVPRQPLCMTAAERQAEADALCNYFTAELLLAKGLAAPRPPSPEIVPLDNDNESRNRSFCGVGKSRTDSGLATENCNNRGSFSAGGSPMNNLLDNTVSAAAASPLSPRTPTPVSLKEGGGSNRHFAVNSFVPTSFLGGGGEFMGALGAIQGIAGNLAIQSDGNNSTEYGNIGNTMKSFVPYNALSNDQGGGVYNPFASLFGGGFSDGSPPALQRSPFSDPSSPLATTSPARTRPREITVHMGAVLQDMPLPPPLGMYLQYIESEARRLFSAAASKRAAEMVFEAEQYHAELVQRSSLLSSGSSTEEGASGNGVSTEGRGLGSTLRRFFGGNKEPQATSGGEHADGISPQSPTARLSSQSLPRVLSDLQRNHPTFNEASPPTSPLYGARLPSAHNLRRGGSSVKPLPPFALKIKISDKSAVKGVDVIEGALRQLFFGAEAVSGTTKGTQGVAGGASGGGTFGSRQQSSGGSRSAAAGHMPTPKTTALSSDWLIPKGPAQLKEIVAEHVVLINHYTSQLHLGSPSTPATLTPTTAGYTPTFGTNVASFALSPPTDAAGGHPHFPSTPAPSTFTNWTADDISLMRAKFHEAAEAFIEDRHRDVLQAYYRIALSDRPNHYRLYLSDDISWEEESLIHLESPCMPAFTALLLKPTARALRFLQPRFGEAFFGSFLPASTLQCGLGSTLVPSPSNGPNSLRVSSAPAVSPTTPRDVATILPPKAANPLTTVPNPPATAVAATTTADAFLIGFDDDELLVSSSLASASSFETTTTQVVRLSPIFLAVAARLLNYTRCEKAVEGDLGGDTSGVVPPTTTFANRLSAPCTSASSLASVTHRYLPLDCLPSQLDTDTASGLPTQEYEIDEALVSHDQYLNLYKHLTQRNVASDSADEGSHREGGAGGGGGRMNPSVNNSGTASFGSMAGSQRRNGANRSSNSFSANPALLLSQQPGASLSNAVQHSRNQHQLLAGGSTFHMDSKGRGRSGALHSFNYSASGVAACGEGSTLIVDASQSNSAAGSSFLKIPKGTWWDCILKTHGQQAPWSTSSGGSASGVSLTSSAAAQVATYYGLSHDQFVALVKVILAASTAAVELSASQQYQEFVASRQANTSSLHHGNGNQQQALPLGSSGSSLFPASAASGVTGGLLKPPLRIGGLASGNSSAHLTGSSGGSSASLYEVHRRPNDIGAMFFASIHPSSTGANFEDSMFTSLFEGGSTRVWGQSNPSAPRSPLISPQNQNAASSAFRTVSTGSNSRAALKQLMHKGNEQLPLPLTVEIAPTTTSGASSASTHSRGNTGPSSFVNLLLKQQSSSSSVTEVELDPYQLLRTFVRTFYPAAAAADGPNSQGPERPTTNIVTSIPDILLPLNNLGTKDDDDNFLNDTSSDDDGGGGAEMNFALTFKPRRLRTLNEDDGVGVHSSVTPTSLTPPTFPVDTIGLEGSPLNSNFSLPEAAAPSATHLAMMTLLSTPSVLFQRQFEGLLLATAAMTYTPGGGEPPVTMEGNATTQSRSPGASSPASPEIATTAVAAKNPVLSHHLRTVSSSVHELLSADTPAAAGSVVVRTASDSLRDTPIAAAVFQSSLTPTSTNTKDEGAGGNASPLRALMKEFLAAPHQLADVYQSPMGSRRSSAADLASRVAGNASRTGSASRRVPLTLTPEASVAQQSGDFLILSSPNDNASFYKGPLGVKRMPIAEQRRQQELREVELRMLNRAMRDFIALFQANTGGSEAFSGVPRPTVTTVVSMVAPVPNAPSTITGPCSLANNYHAARGGGGGMDVANSRSDGIPTPLSSSSPSSPVNRQPSPPPLLPSPTSGLNHIGGTPSKMLAASAGRAKDVTRANNPTWLNPIVTMPQVFRTGPVDDVLVTVEIRVRLPSAQAADYHKSGYAALLTNTRSRLKGRHQSSLDGYEVNNGSITSQSNSSHGDKNASVVSIRRSVVVPAEMTIDNLEDHIMKEIGIDVVVSKVPSITLTADEEHILRRHTEILRGSVNADDAEFSSDDDVPYAEIAKQAAEISRRKMATLPYLLFVKYGPLLELTVDERFDFLGAGGGVTQAPYMYAPPPPPPNPIRGTNLDSSITSANSAQNDGTPLFGFYNPNLFPPQTSPRGRRVPSETPTPNASFPSQSSRIKGPRFGVGSSAIVAEEDLARKVEEQRKNNELASQHFHLTELGQIHQQHLAGGWGAGTDGVDVLDGYTRGRESHMPPLRDHTVLALARHGVDTYVLDLSTIPADALRVKATLPPLGAGPQATPPTGSPGLINSSLTGDKASTLDSKYRLGTHRTSSGNALADMDDGPMSMLPFSAASLRSNARSSKALSSPAASAIPPAYTPQSPLELWLIDQCRFTALTVNPHLNVSVAYGNEHLPYQRDEEREEDNGSDTESESTLEPSPTKGGSTNGGGDQLHKKQRLKNANLLLDPTASADDDIYFNWCSAAVVLGVLQGRSVPRPLDVSKYDRRFASLHFNVQRHRQLSIGILRELLHQAFLRGDDHLGDAKEKRDNVRIPASSDIALVAPTIDWRASIGTYCLDLADRYNTGNRYAFTGGDLNPSLLTTAYASAPVRASRDATSLAVTYTCTRPVNDFIVSQFYKGGGVGAVGKLEGSDGGGAGGGAPTSGGGADHYSLLYSRLDEDEARAYQHFDVIKINKYGTPQRRVIGVDGERIYNMRPSSEVGKTKNPERNVSDIKVIRTYPERPLYFEIEYRKEVKVDTDCIECRSVADCLLMVEKLRVLKRMLDLKAGGRQLAGSRQPRGSVANNASTASGVATASTPRSGGAFKKVLFKLGIGTKD